jgi:iron complex outermembrane receptor protein
MHLGGIHVSDQASSQLQFRRTAIARSVSAAVMASVAGTAAAQEIEEVIVTATKREESIQDVPLAITAFTGDFMRQVNLDDVKDLVTFAPGVAGNSTDAFIDGISIRGVRTQDFGVGGDPSAAFFKNNLYEGRNGAVVTSLYDLERAEVLRGPQGFLFGRNAVGGAFSVHTKRPNLSGNTDGYFEADVGERGRFDVEGAATAGLTDNSAIRVALYHSQQDGHVRNVFNNQDFLAHDKTAGRVSYLYATDKLEVLATAEYEEFDRDGSQYGPRAWRSGKACLAR